MKCMMCKDRESTGIIFQMCDECFEGFEKRTAEANAEGHKYELTEEEFAAVSEDYVVPPEERPN